MANISYPSSVAYHQQALTLAKIQDKYFDITKHTKGILFIGTPHRGSDYAWFGWLFARTLWFLDSHPGILEGLHYDALFLRDLHSEFISAFGTQVQIINLFEERKAVWFHIWGYRCWTGYVGTPRYIMLIITFLANV